MEIVDKNIEDIFAIYWRVAIIFIGGQLPHCCFFGWRNSSLMGTVPHGVAVNKIPVPFANCTVCRNILL